LVLIREPVAKQCRPRRHPPADAAKNGASEPENPQAKQVDEFPESVAETQLKGKLRLPIFCTAKCAAYVEFASVSANPSRILSLRRRMPLTSRYG
jgi:hypothetical protein